MAGATHDLTGQRVGDFLLLRRIGRGGMATVYAALQESLDRQVAFKILNADLASDSQYLQRFRNEARAVAALSHVNIVQIHEVGSRDGIHYLVQELVDGGSLKQLLQRCGALPYPEAIRLLQQVADGLQHAGERGIIHRDIKPDNILITRSGVAKIADFGLARQMLQPATAVTQEGLTLGTPYYMSPEQVQGQPLDRRSDLYALGVTGYQMLSGRLPFDGETALAVAAMHLHDTPPALASLCPQIPGALADVIHRLLAKRPQDRFDSGGQLRTILDQIERIASDGTVPTMPLVGATVALPMSQAATQPQLSCAATVELQRALMESRGRSAPRRPRLADPTVLAVLASIVIGSCWAWFTREPNWLTAPVARGEAPEIGLEVTRAETVLDQFFQAQMADTESGWRAVTEYFPASESSENAVYAERAQQQLARWYQARKEWGELARLGRSLAHGSGSSDHLRAFGLACQFMAQQAQSDMAAAAQLWDELRPLLSELPADLRRTVQQAAKSLPERALPDGDPTSAVQPHDHQPGETR